MARKSPAFSFYPDSWLGGVALMSPVERAAYINLLCIAWLHGGFTREQAYRACSDIPSGAVDAVLESKFEAGKDGVFKNGRLEEEREKQQSRSNNGKKGGRPQKLSESETKANGKLNDNQTAKLSESETKDSVSVSVSVSGSDSDSNSSSETHTPAKPASASPLARELFDQFWSKAHVKLGREVAFKAFGKAVKRKAKEASVTQREAAQMITEAMTAFAASPSAHPPDRSPIHPATWLNQGRYDDDRSRWNGEQARERVKF